MHFARYALLVCSIALLGAATQPAPSDPIGQFLWDRKDVFGSSYPFLTDAPLDGDPRYLLEGESHRRLMQLLDGVLFQDIDHVAPSPSVRALMQHELWQVFDYTIETQPQPDEAARDALRKKLAAAMRKLALTRQQIEALPENLATSAGPTGAPPVEDVRSGWVGRGDKKSPQGSPLRLWANILVAPSHTEAFEGRSAFDVLMRFPDGPAAAEAYLQKLSADPAMTKPAKPGFDARVHSIPQFPVGTRLALLRKMILIDREGELVCSPIIESLQVRTFVRIGDRKYARPWDVVMEEFVLDRDRFAAGRPGALHAIGLLEFEPMEIFPRAALSVFARSAFGGRPNDFRAAHPRLSECYECHAGPGIKSMNSFAGFFGAKDLKPYAANFDTEANLAIRYRNESQQQQMLRQYWAASSR